MNKNSGRIYVEKIHRFSRREVGRLRKFGWLKLSKSVGKCDGYIEIEAPTTPAYLSMVYRIRHMDASHLKHYTDSFSMKVDIKDMCKITNSEIQKLKSREIDVVKYDNERPSISDNLVWCTIYGDNMYEIYSGVDRVTKLIRGDILGGSKWCGKHNRFGD